MIRPQDTCEIKLSYEDVREAVEEYLNKNISHNFITVTLVRTSQSKDYTLIVEFE